MGKTVNEQVAKGTTLVAGLRKNSEEMLKRGISAEVIDRLESLCSKTAEQGSEQDKIKDMYHQKTAEVSALMLELKSTINDIKKAVKPYYPQAEWIKFGIEDKK